MVAIGPVLTFFLWLTLAVSASSNMAASSLVSNSSDFGFANTSGSLLKIFEVPRMLSFVLGIAMIYAGFEAAQSVCGGVGGFISAALSKAKGAPKQLAAFGARLGAKGARKVGKGARKGFGLATTAAGGWAENKRGLNLLTKKGRADTLRSIAAGAGDSALGRIVNRAASSRADKLEAARRDKIAKAGEVYKDASKRTTVDQLERFAPTRASDRSGKSRYWLNERCDG